MDIVKRKAETAVIGDRFAILIATAGGAGFAPKAPGTMGSVVGVLLYLVIEGLGAGAYYLHVIILLLIAGIWAARRVEELDGHDSQRIVIDEVIGQMIAFAPAAGRFQLSALYILIGFGLFRFFDIAKPFPLRRLEQFSGGVGVIADDVGAGIYAMAALTLIRNGLAL
jgi:phosphatidylglycerophosphatase A